MQSGIYLLLITDLIGLKTITKKLTLQDDIYLSVVVFAIQPCPFVISKNAGDVETNVNVVVCSEFI